VKSRITRAGDVVEVQPGTLIGEYEVQAQIGEGAMGTVYMGVHPVIGKKVAIKVLKPELCANQASIDRFVQEAQAINQIGHPNIVDVFSLGELEDGRADFVMELLRGEGLKTRLAKGPVAAAEACDILDGIARALEAAHAKGIIHRDLKPDNVYLHQVEDGAVMVKLLDFGIAKLVRSTPGAEKTQTGNMLGTPRYISPEAARGVHVDHRTDVYSLGVIAYEMLGGKPPFDGETAMDIVVAHMNEPPPPLGSLAKLPRSLEQCVMRMLEKDPANRPSLAEVRAIFVDPSRRMTPLPGRLYTQPRPAVAMRERRRWPYAVAGVAVLAVGGVVAWRVAGGASASEAAAPPPPPAPVAAAPVAAPPAPPPPPRAEPARGTLAIAVKNSKDAAIVVDGSERGHGTSLRIDVDAGHHEVVIKPPRGPAISQTVEVTSGDTSTLTIVVSPPAPVRTTKKPPARKPPAAKPHDDDELLRPAGHH
jgi:tRNA A-37 threonylcarbamoyl transferase component Bud32